MKRVVIAFALACGGVAVGQELPLVPKQGAEEVQPPSRTPEKLREIPFFYRELDRERVNEGTLGRLNATRGEQQEMLTGWGSPGTGGNVM